VEQIVSFAVISAGALLVDQVSKFAILRLLTDSAAVWVLRPRLVRPSRLLGRSAVAVAALAGLGLVLAVAVAEGRLGSGLGPAAAGLAFGGSAGNVIDRVRRGVVVDFIDLGWWPAFNLADAAIVVGVVTGLLALP
jgi:signal peptidase II